MKHNNNWQKDQTVLKSDQFSPRSAEIKDTKNKTWNLEIKGPLIWSRDIICLHILLHRKFCLRSKICNQIMSLDQMRDPKVRKICQSLLVPDLGYRHQPSQSRVDIEHWLKANTAWSARSITRFTSVLAWCYVGEDLSAKLVTDLF